MAAKAQNIIGTTKKTSENLKLHSKKSFDIGAGLEGHHPCGYSL